MIIFNNPRLIFIHIHKTGGETIERTLAPLARWNDLILGSDYPGVSRDYERLYGVHKHSSACDVTKLLGGEIWSSYFSWSLVRNPYERIASFYSYVAAISEPELSAIGFPLEGTPQEQQVWLEAPDYRMTDQWGFAGVRAYLATRSSQTPFSDFLRHPLLISDEPAYLTQFSRLCNDGATLPLVDAVLKLETLSTQWPALARELGFPPIPLVITNVTPHQWKRSARELFANPADLELVNSLYADDFRWFNYDMIGRDPTPRIFPMFTQSHHASPFLRITPAPTSG